MTARRPNVDPLPVTKPGKWAPEHARALKALQEGVASEAQQKMALAWILTEACQMAADPFQQDERTTNYMAGRQSVGRQILALLNAKGSQPKEDE